MSQSTRNQRKEFLCPQCHQDMSNTETLQAHLQTVHTKQSSTSVKSFFSLAKLTIKTVQGNFKPPPSEPPKPYALCFASSSNDTYSKIGYLRSSDEYFRTVRKAKLDLLVPITRQTLLRIEFLTNTNENIPRNGNTKERIKYEQSVVAWMEDSVSSTCASCSKSFGLFGRKHHCRLDGKTICNQCSRFISFSTARWILELNASSSLNITEVIRLRLNNLLNVTSSMVTNDDPNEEQLRVCLPCGRFIQRNYDKIRFQHLEKDELFHHYAKIVQAKSECEHAHPTYSVIIESLWNGETNYQINDAQRLYEQLHLKYDRIDSASKVIAKLPEVGDKDDKRYAAICRNIRAYSVQVIQNYSLRTKRVPNGADIKRICDERTAKLTLETPVVRSKSGAIQFVRHEDSIDGNNEIVLLDFR